MGSLSAGAAQESISPAGSQFLFGYPHAPRYSTGIHDLLSSALCLRHGSETILFIGNDIVFVGKANVERIRARISDETGIPGSSIMISATHTHSGPITVDHLSNESDPVVPKADAGYVHFMEERIVRAGVRAALNLVPAEIAVTVADGTGVGTNRRDPAGAVDLEVPVLQVREQGRQSLLACMLVCSMHPTVLHEDSTLISGNFPGMARQELQRSLGEECVVVYHTGPEGNQSPRHVTTENTFAEAERLGSILATAVERALPEALFSSDGPIWSRQTFLDLSIRSFPPVSAGEAKLAQSIEKLERLRTSCVSSQEFRTAECDWFGAEETLTLAKAAEDGRLSTYAGACLPAEIQVLGVGPWIFVAWPGEFFVEYGLRVKAASPRTFVINLANGELQGYIVTEEAAREGGYEASNGLLDPDAGEMFVRRSVELIR